LRGLLSLAGALLALALCAVSASASKTAAGATLIIEGAGDGHGVGMSQYGALGFAEHGYSDTQILAHYYTGTAIGQAPAGDIVRVLVGSKVLDVPLEQYVRGVVAAEMPASWPAAALEAQAIASRTYALTSDAGGSKFDVYSDTRSQVYRGAAAETPQSNAAVSATAGQIVTYAGQPAVTYFFASSGGMTENIENAFYGAAPEPWLKGVADPYETSVSSWKLSMTMTGASTRLAGLVKGTLLGIEVLKRGVSPRIVSAELLGSRGDTPVNGAELEGLLGLPSTWAYFSLKNGTSVTREPDLSGQAPRGAPTAGAPATPAAPAPPTPVAAVAAARKPVFDDERGGTVAPSAPEQQYVGSTGGVLAP
jgi:SpoIID/LytB domain protein